MHNSTDSLSLSSQLGREWLISLSGQHTQRKVESIQTIQRLECPVICIPNFETFDDEGTSSLSTDFDSSNVGNALSSPSSQHQNRSFVAKDDVAADLTEKPDEWIAEPIPTPDPRKNAFQSPEFHDVDELTQSAIESFSNQILDRFPLAAPTLLLFVGSENNPHTDKTCAKVAESLAERNVGNVLLIDSNQLGVLSGQRGLDNESGVTNLIQQNDDWRIMINCERSANLDFLPVGNKSWDCWGGVQRLRHVSAEMKRHYQFICVSAGDAHHQNSKLWSGVCDGSYLFISLAHSNQTIAESAVSELQLNGARLLGCVVTDAA